MRYPVPATLPDRLRNARIEAVTRRGKFLLVHVAGGALLLHLGMSGRLAVLRGCPPPGPHDHLDFVVDNGRTVRFHDPRRFGMALWADGDPPHHPLLATLGPEPLGRAFSGAGLWQRARGRRVAIKPFIMDARTVVGVGNIYASEALHRAGIHPQRAAGRVSAARMETLAAAIRTVLREAIRAGGTTLRDFRHGDGQPGYFTQQLRVYGKAGAPCPGCGTALRHLVLGQRASYFCPRCQR